MKDDLAEFSLRYAQDLGATYVEVRLEETQANTLVMKNGVVQATESTLYEGIGLRFLVNHKLGFVSTNTLTKKRLAERIAKGIKITKAAKEASQDIGLSKEHAYRATYEVKQKKKLREIDIKDRLSPLQEAEKAISKIGVQALYRYITLQDEEVTELLRTSEGTRIRSRIPRVSAYYFLTVNENNRSMQRYQMYGATGGWDQVLQWDLPKILTEEVTAMKLMLTKGKKLPPQKLPIICGPEVTGIIVHESCGHPFEADRILGREAAQAGESYISKNDRGRVLGSPVVTIVDNPLVENSYGFYRYDHEGVKARQKVLLKKGIVTEFLHNRETAWQMGLKSNGSSRASDFEKEAIIRMSNTFMVPGDYDQEELFEGIKRGVYLKNFTEWNIDDRRLNQKYTGSTAFLIENGELTQPLLNPVLEISSTKLYPAIDAVGKDLKFYAGSCGKGEPMQSIPVYLGGPSIRLQGLRIK